MLTLNELHPGAVAIDSRGRIAIILEHKLNNPKNPIIYTNSAGGTVYKGPTSLFKAVVGLADLEDFENAGGGRENIQRGTDSDWAVPQVLKGIKIGDKIKIRGRRGLEIVTYQGYNTRRPKYPVSFQRDSGASYKAPVSIVVGAA
jgi:hypothetical protein